MRLLLTKLEAARRQLETAVRLWFGGGDPVAIHTLASAGGDVLRDIAEATDGDATVGTDRILSVVRPEHRKEVRRLLRQSQNFLKHADLDPESVLEFETQEADMRLLNACEAYRLIASARSPVITAYETYAAFTWANHLLEDDKRHAFPADLALKLAGLPRDEALTWLVEALGEDGDA